MKYLKFLLVGLLSSFAFSTVPDNAVDFTATDVNGKSHTLFTYLNAGNYVMIDYSANSAS